MFHDTQQGQFWFSGEPEHQAAGTLSIEDKGRLRLTTRVVENGSLDGLRDFFEEDDSPRTICGATPSGYVTLVEATPNGRKIQFNPSLPEGQRTWDCNYALQSRTYQPTPLEEDITSVEVHIQFLPTWASDGNNFLLDWQNGTLTWPTKLDVQTSKWCLGEVGLRYSPRISGSDPGGRRHSAEIWIDTSFFVRFDRPQPLDTVLDTVSSLQALVSIAKGEPASIERILLTVAVDDTEHKVLFHYSPVLWPAYPASKDSELFSFSEIGATEGVAVWLNALRDLPHVINGLLIDRYHRPPFVTDVTLYRLLACEAYQRKIDNKIGKQIGLNETLPALDPCPSSFLKWVGSWKAWIGNIARIRNNLVAHLQSYGRPTQDFTSVVLVNRQLYTYLVVRLLTQCGLSNELLELVVDRASSEAIRRLPWNSGRGAPTTTDRFTTMNQVEHN